MQQQQQGAQREKTKGLSPSRSHVLAEAEATSAGGRNDGRDGSIVVPPHGEDVSGVDQSDLSSGTTIMDKPQPSSTLLQEQKKHVAHPRGIFQQKEPTGADMDDTTSAALAVGGNLTVLRGIGKNQPPKVGSLLDPTVTSSTQDATSNNDSKSRNNTSKSAVPGVVRGLRNNEAKTGVLSLPTTNSNRQDNSSKSDSNHTKSVVRGLRNNEPKTSVPSYIKRNISHQKSNSNRDRNDTKLVVRGLRNNPPKAEVKTNIATHAEQQARGLLSQRHGNPSYVSYLDDGVEPSDHELQEEVDNILSDDDEEEVLPVEVAALTGDQLDNVLQESPQDSDGPLTFEDTSREANPSPSLTAPTETTPGNNNDGLVEAMPVEDDHFVSDLMEAQPVNQEDLDQRSGRESRHQKKIRFGCGVVVVACVVLTVSLVIHQTAKKHSAVLEEKDTLTPSPIRPMPPLENMELLYHSLPEKTKESLYNSTSPQYQAWEWLLNHPNITAYPEWRKTQVFALATFYYSFGGSNWPDERPGRDRWMDETISECRWILSEDEIDYYAQLSLSLFGPIYGLEDYRPCNEDGEIQWILAHHLNFPIEPVMPPEIVLLTSLRILGIFETQNGGKLSDLFVTELIEHPSLEHFSFGRADFSGTLPAEIGLMTGLRHFVIGENKLTGTIQPTLA